MAAAALAAASLLVPATAGAGDDVAFDMHRQGDALQVRAHAFLSAPMPLVWRVLTDYERMPRFIPGIARSVVRQRQGNHLLVEHTGDARFLFFTFPIDVTLEVDELPMQWVTSRAVGHPGLGSEACCIPLPTWAKCPTRWLSLVRSF